MSIAKQPVHVLANSAVKRSEPLLKGAPGANIFICPRPRSEFYAGDLDVELCPAVQIVLSYREVAQPAKGGQGSVRRNGPRVNLEIPDEIDVVLHPAVGGE